MHTPLRDPLSDRFLIDHALRAGAQATPDRLALISEGRRLTYAELNALVDRCASTLREAGVTRGERVIGVLDNGIDAVVTYYGAIRADGVPSLLPANTRGRRFGQVVQVAEPRALIVARSAHECLAALPDLSHGTPPPALFLTGAPAPAAAAAAAAATAAPTAHPLPEGRDLPEALAAAAETPPPRRSIELDLATLCWTSGSTGEPKGVMLTHQNLRASATAIGTYLAHTPEDIVLCVLPLSHTYGLFQLLVTHLFGGTLVLEKGFSMPWPIVQRLADEKITGFAGVPTIFASMLSLKNLAKADLSALRYMTNAAYGLPGAQVLRLRELLPAVQFFAMYGQTECTRVCYLPPALALEKPASVGIAMPNEELWIQREDGTRALPGETGELVVRGPNVMRGYFRNPEATARALQPGDLPGEVVLHTGDLFRTDDDGHLYFVARKDDIIKTRGEKVSPLEVESVVCRIPGVIEAAAVGVPDAVLGQAVKIVVVRGEQAEVSADDIRRKVRSDMDEIAVPKFVEFVDTLPKTASGKVKKSELL
ncbi:class I adenylate-forming enzyme family protein [Chondromyces apiculatus]|uniref:Long-chain-fatty-acid--CoA ligase n=1 Tax=Chondromyces apiculatus DSM 436 TaxID=1192034 RepID=A0A017T1M9_9BACT|nr:class I adenylate-forming enzyme family protein [Chondromyces apiculatus]EYF03159.1 Long-chain-fatty-acid--CoA ligase [Chondromyces apiculatus DSM 436]